MFTLVADHVWTRTSFPKDRAERNQWRATVGTKALGLVSLPDRWVPPFVIIGTSLYREWRPTRISKRPLMIAATANTLLSIIAERGYGDLGLVIRSSAVTESMSDRGAYQSLELPADFNEQSIINSVHKIFADFNRTGVNDELALIVQSRIYLSNRGHLSNERRVSKTSNHWMWEIEGNESVDGRFNSQRASPPNSNEPLKLPGNGRKALLDLFRKIGRWCTELNEGRVHLEWGIDGHAFWLFQLDFEDEQIDEGVDPNTLLRPDNESRGETQPVATSVHNADFFSSTGWPKIDKVREFLVDRLEPYPKLYYLTGTELQRAIAAKRDMTMDIYSVVGNRGVCRTDCSASGLDQLNLPRTDSVSPRQMMSFMTATLEDLVAKGANPGGICFIFHKFIPAKIAAWAFARPNQQLVLVDALWGLPDGLQYLSHDTFEFDIRRNAISAEQIRFKPKFLQEIDSGEWKLINVARKFARHRTLGLSDLREVAIQTHGIATRLQKPIQIMWFCSVLESAGVGRNVPWFMTEPELSAGFAPKPVPPERKRFPIKSMEDIERARHDPSAKIILFLEPEGNLFRSSEFLSAVVSVALERRLPVLMTGSILAHAYYTLERRGVSVVTDTSRRSRVRQRQVFGKLVRDEIPAKIAEHGEQANLAHIAKPESRTALVIKLFEEAQELIGAISPDEVTTELADLLEVVRALAAATGVSWDEVQSVAEHKRNSRGSFARNVVLMETSWPRWEHDVEQRHERIIPLKDLARVIGGDGQYLVNFISAIARGADNVVDLGNGTRIAVSIVDGGVKISRVNDFERDDSHQLDFEFVSANDDGKDG